MNNFHSIAQKMYEESKSTQEEKTDSTDEVVDAEIIEE